MIQIFLTNWLHLKLDSIKALLSIKSTGANENIPIKSGGGVRERKKKLQSR